MKKGSVSSTPPSKGPRCGLRPILMTSFAFILGCVPLATSHGAGALSRQVMGFTVIGGMLAASGIAIFLIPVLFYVMEKLSVLKRESAPTLASPPTPAADKGGAFS